MPYGDRRGPNGLGPMTGRGLGLCNGYETPGCLNDFGYGRGRGRGRGAGFRAGYGREFGYGRGYAARAPITKEEEKNILESEISRLNNDLESLKKRLSLLNNDNK